MERNNRIVFSYKVASALLDKGFTLVDTVRNKANLMQYVYFFKREPGLEEAIAELTSK